MGVPAYLSPPLGLLPCPPSLSIYFALLRKWLLTSGKDCLPSHNPSPPRIFGSDSEGLLVPGGPACASVEGSTSVSLVYRGFPGTSCFYLPLLVMAPKEVTVDR